MRRLPGVSGRAVIGARRKEGFVVVRQRGSHVRLKKVSRDSVIKISVPLHLELKRGTLRHIIKAAELSVGEFLELL